MDETKVVGTGSADVEHDAGQTLTRETLLRRAAAGAVAVSAAGALGPIGEAIAATRPKRGGTLRVGVAGGSSKDLLDAQYINDVVDIARTIITYEPLLDLDARGAPVLTGLAQELEPNKDASVWTIRVRQGVEFHNGKTLTADDIIYSLRRIVTPKLGLSGSGGLSASIDPKRLRKMDKYTVRAFLKQSDATMPDQLAQYYNGIAPVGYQRWPAPQNGTGAFKLQKLTPGSQSEHVRFNNYWRSGQPYLDRVIVLDIPDGTARTNALLSGQVHAITDIPYARVRDVSSRSSLAILKSPGGGQWEPIVMAVDSPPFNDVRVRQAMRLIINRRQLVSQVLSGYGVLGNDIFGGPVEPAYASVGLPQRDQDLDRARSLLKAAGKEDLTVELVTWPGTGSLIPASTAFAQQAKGAGVTVNLKQLDPGGFYAGYLKWSFFISYWGAHSYLFIVGASTLSNSPYNETHWNDPRYAAMYKQALRTVDDKKRNDIIHQLMRIDYERGGYIIPYFTLYVDAYNKRLRGLVPSTTQRLGFFGHGFRNTWLA